jgi:hypothetical protein
VIVQDNATLYKPYVYAGFTGIWFLAEAAGSSSPSTADQLGFFSGLE